VEPDGEVQFTPEDALPDIRVLAITVSIDEEGERRVDLHLDDFHEDEVLGLLKYALVKVESAVAYDTLAEIDDDED
jgi:hypothetical protein